MKVWEHINKYLEKYASQIIEENDRQITYYEAKIFSMMLSKQISSEKCCAIYCYSELNTAISLLACFAAGVTAVPLSPRYGTKHCEHILQYISPSCVISDSSGNIEIYRISDSNYIVPQPSPILIMCTSGTSGVPKGVMLSEENILSNISDISEYFKIGCKDTILIIRPLYHCAVLTGEFLISLTKGLKIIFESKDFNPLKILSIIDKCNVTVFCGTPTILNILVGASARSGKNKTLKHVVVSGERITQTTTQQIRKQFSNASIYSVYGLTEASPRISYMPPEYLQEAPDCVGIPLKSVKLSIRRQDGTSIENNENGILWVNGPNVMLGYYNDTENTAKVLQKGWLCTGDIATYNKDGWLKILGRSDDLIIRAGMNIYPAEIESKIKTDKRVYEVLVYGFNDDRFGTQIAMKISGDFLTVDDVKKLCIKVLPTYAIPSKIELVDELPKNGSGKLIRKDTHND